MILTYIYIDGYRGCGKFASTTESADMTVDQDTPAVPSLSLFSEEILDDRVVPPGKH